MISYNIKEKNMKIKVYNEEGILVACDEETICELIENNGYKINPSKKEMKKLRIESGYEDENS
tara:strand:- start:74 stop:262 length:189 start_codon:yes stop_codon:yes gene_type:complete